MIVVLGTYAGRLSKLTMKVSIMPMEVEDEGEWGRKSSSDREILQKHFQKVQVGVRTRSTSFKNKKEKKKKGRQEKKRKEEKEKNMPSKYIFPSCMLPITLYLRQQLVRTQIGLWSKENCA